MGCRSDYMEPIGREVESNTVAKHIVYLNESLGRKSSDVVEKAASSIYGEPLALDWLTAELCGALKSLTPSEEASLVYNGRSSKARELADWWDCYKRFDAEREAEETAKAERLRLIESARSKLTVEEMQALGLDR